MVYIDLQQLNTFGGKNACEDCACPMQVISANQDAGDEGLDVIVRRGIEVDDSFTSVILNS